MKTSDQLTKKLINAIVTDKRPYNQDFGRKYINECSSQNAKNTLISEIFDCVRDRELTAALEILQYYGITGDLAVLMLANLQSLGGAA